MLLRPKVVNNVTICEVGVHKFSQIHKFQVMLVVKKEQQPPVLIRLLDGPLQRMFSITLLPDPLTGVKVYERDQQVFNRADANNDRLDSRWKINMKAFPNHGNADFNDGAQPVATLNVGVIYASNLSRDGLRPVLKKGPTKVQDLYRVADLAAEIPLQGNSRVTLAWHDHGQAQTLELPRAGEEQEAGTTYTVVLLNDPAISSPASHDELEEYYKVLGINENDRLSLIYETNPKSDEIPCLPVTLE